MFIKKLLTLRLTCGKDMYITSDIDDRLYYTGYIIRWSLDAVVQSMILCSFTILAYKCKQALYLYYYNCVQDIKQLFGK